MPGSPNNRARLTPVDVVYYGVALLIIAFFAGPMYTIMNDNASQLGTGTAYLYQLVFPGLVATLIFVVYLTGASGGGR